AYLDHFFPGSGSIQTIASWHLGRLSMSLSPRSIVAIAIIFALAIVHARGLGPGRLVQNLLTTLKIGGLSAFVIIGLIMSLRLPRPAVPAPIARPWSPWLMP